MKILARKWSQEDVDFLHKHLQRTEAATRHKASRLGILRKGEGRMARISQHRGYLYVSSLDMKTALHRLIMEYKLGRKLESDEIVHHIDGNPLNNHPDNLSLECRSSHMKIHDEDRVRNDRGQYT